MYELIVLRRSPETSAFVSIAVLFGVILYQEIRRSFSEGTGLLAGVKGGIRLTAEGLVKGSRNMVPVALACASAGIIVGVVNMGLGGMIAQIVEILAMGNIFLLLLITAIASLLLGMGLPTTATYIVMASLTAPIIVQVGALYGFAIPLMAAHLFCFYFGILADDTPPVGLAAYAASAIAGSNPISTGIQGFLYDIRTSIIAFLFVFNPELILHNINSWPLGLLIFAMALIGISAFECVAQGWCIGRVRWYEALLLLFASFVLFHPGAVLPFMPFELPGKYYLFPLGILIYAVVVLEQKVRFGAMARART